MVNPGELQRQVGRERGLEVAAAARQLGKAPMTAAERKHRQRQHEEQQRQRHKSKCQRSKRKAAVARPHRTISRLHNWCSVCCAAAELAHVHA